MYVQNNFHFTQMYKGETSYIFLFLRIENELAISSPVDNTVYIHRFRSVVRLIYFKSTIILDNIFDSDLVWPMQLMIIKG